MLDVNKDVSHLPEYIWEMVALASGVRENAYTPYSKFKVGAAIRTKDGQHFVGCNVEEAAYIATHAEQNAIGTMVSTVGRQLITDVVVVGGSVGDNVICAPCGHCRQWLREHGVDETRVIVVGPEALNERCARLVTTLGELLPLAFGPSDLSIDRTA